MTDNIQCAARPALSSTVKDRLFYSVLQEAPIYNWGSESKVCTIGMVSTHVFHCLSWFSKQKQQEFTDKLFSAQLSLWLILTLQIFLYTSFNKTSKNF